MLNIPHIFAEDIPDDYYSPADDESAKFAWNCICDLFVEAFRYYDNADFSRERWDEGISRLHYALFAIENYTNDNIGQYLDCMACDFAISIDALVRLRLAENIKQFLFDSSDGSEDAFRKRLQFDLCSVFFDPFSNPSTTLTMKAHPKELDGIKHALARASISIRWVEYYKNGETPPAYLINGLPSSPVLLIETEEGITTNYSIRNIAIATANAQAVAYGGDAKVVNAPIVSAENNTNLTIKKGAFQNNSTFQVAGQGEVVRETRETFLQALEWAKENPGAVLGNYNGGKDRPNGIGGRKADNEDQEKADAALWNDWETAKAAKVPKAKFAIDRGMTMNQVQNVLDRHRKRLNS